jgi:hypothetical protein
VTLLDMQRVLSRLLTDTAFRTSFIAGAEPRPAGYDLSSRELASLRNLHWARVSLHSHLLLHGRLQLALKAMPLTTALLKAQLHDHLDRFCAEYPPVPEEASGLALEAGRLSDFALGLLREGTLTPSWASDIVTYERTLVTLAASEEAAASADRVAGLNECRWPPEQLAGLVPVAGPHARVASFSYSLPDLITVAEAGDGPQPVPLPVPMLILFHKTSRGPVQVARVNAAAAARVEACDGTRTAAGVLDQLRPRFGAGLDARAMAALGWLRDHGVVGLRPGA